MAYQSINESTTFVNTHKNLEEEILNRKKDNAIKSEQKKRQQIKEWKDTLTPEYIENKIISAAARDKTYEKIISFSSFSNDSKVFTKRIAGELSPLEHLKTMISPQEYKICVSYDGIYLDWSYISLFCCYFSDWTCRPPFCC